MKILMIALLCTIPLTGLATGKLTCDSGDPSTWQSQDALKEKLIGEGWSIRKTKVDGGCYELYGTTPEGDRAEAYFDPITFEKLLVHQRGRVLFRKE